jgi:small subunit ribosomal protein S2
MKELLETGVHFGHRTRKWNPKMARYIFTERKGIHIIDLEQTVDMFKKAYFFVRDSVAEGKEILFVGTKKQVQTTIVDEARRCGAHYVNRRWLGGTLTNFATIRQSIKRMKDLETMMEDGSIDHFSNKEANRLRRELAKLQRNLDGLRHLERVPDILYVIDPDVEANAVHEANILKIPVLAIVDTNCDPDPIDFPIPGNDDAIKATKLITSRIADAVLEGREGRQEEAEEPVKVAGEEPVAKAEAKAEEDTDISVKEPVAATAESTEGAAAESVPEADKEGPAEAE